GSPGTAGAARLLARWTAAAVRAQEGGGAVCGAWWAQADARASMGDRGAGQPGCGAARFAAHAAPLGGDPHGLAWGRPAHGAIGAGTRRHLDHADLHARGAGPAAEGVRRASSPGRGTGRVRGNRCRSGLGRWGTQGWRAMSAADAGQNPVGEALAGFLRALVARNASAHTVKAYRTDLAEFVKFVGPEELKEIDHLLIRAFLGQLYERGLGKASVARSLSSIRSFFKWMGRERRIESNPALLVAAPKLPKRLPRVPTMEEMNLVLDAKMPEEAAFAERDRLILELLYGCGIRNSELTGINVEDIHLGQGLILVRGKGKKQRLVPFGEAARMALGVYLPERVRTLEEHRRTGECALLINLRGTRLTTRSVGRIV